MRVLKAEGDYEGVVDALLALKRLKALATHGYYSAPYKMKGRFIFHQTGQRMCIDVEKDGVIIAQVVIEE